jgi:RHS repeat-associated protein
MTDAAGAVVWRAEYKPFGEEHQIQATKDNDLRFVGKEKDEETGLLYFGARYMEALIGRFLAPDPVGAVDEKTGKVNSKNLLNPQRLNYYAYGLNNPYKYVDPDGRDVWFIGGSASAFIGRIDPVAKQAKQDQRGYGVQASFGVAYDTESKRLIIFSSGGTANQTEDKVLGVNVGAGLTGGKIEGGFVDFLGESREKSKTFIFGTKTDIETSTNKEGVSYSIGGKGLGLSYTSITTNTFDMTERTKEIIKKKQE